MSCLLPSFLRLLKYLRCFLHRYVRYVLRRHIQWLCLRLCRYTRRGGLVGLHDELLFPSGQHHLDEQREGGQIHDDGDDHVGDVLVVGSQVGQLQTDDIQHGHEDAGENAFKAEYETWYGRDVMELVPSQAIMGYDTATFLIKYLRGELGENGFEGIQTGFNIVTPEGAQGFINNHLYMINFRPNGKVTKTIIK